MSGNNFQDLYEILFISHDSQICKDTQTDTNHPYVSTFESSLANENMATIVALAHR